MQSWLCTRGSYKIERAESTIENSRKSFTLRSTNLPGIEHAPSVTGCGHSTIVPWKLYVGGVLGSPPTPWIHPHTTQIQGDLPTPLTHNNTHQHTTTLHNSTRVHKNTNVPLFKKLWDIIFFFWDNHFMSHFKGHFEGASTFLTPKLSLAALGTI